MIFPEMWGGSSPALSRSLFLLQCEGSCHSPPYPQSSCEANVRWCSLQNEPEVCQGPRAGLGRDRRGGILGWSLRMIRLWERAHWEEGHHGQEPMGHRPSTEAQRRTVCIGSQRACRWPWPDISGIVFLCSGRCPWITSSHSVALSFFSEFCFFSGSQDQETTPKHSVWHPETQSKVDFDTASFGKWLSSRHNSNGIISLTSHQRLRWHLTGDIS